MDLIKVMKFIEMISDDLYILLLFSVTLISVNCREIKPLIIELAAHIMENLSVIAAVKNDDIMIDPIADIEREDVIKSIRSFLINKDLDKEFVVGISKKEIRIIGLSEKRLVSNNYKPDLLICPHCGKVTPYEEEMNVHIRSHYVLTN